MICKREGCTNKADVLESGHCSSICNIKRLEDLLRCSKEIVKQVLKDLNYLREENEQLMAEIELLKKLRARDKEERG